jgi:hypothetical protein
MADLPPVLDQSVAPTRADAVTCPPPPIGYGLSSESQVASARIKRYLVEGPTACGSAKCPATRGIACRGLYHSVSYRLHAMEDPPDLDYPKELLSKVGPRNVLHCVAIDKDAPTFDPCWGEVGKQKKDWRTVFQERGVSPWQKGARHESR